MEALLEPTRFCLTCGYCLRGLPVNRCPECGGEFDPDNPFTFSRSQKTNLLTKWLARPPSEFTQWLAGPVIVHSIRLTLAALAFAFAAHAILVTPFICWIVCFSLWSLAAGMWIVNLLACTRIRPFFSELLMPTRQLWLRRAALPVTTALILTFLLVETRIPFLVHYYARRSALEALRLELMEPPLKPIQYRMQIGELAVSRLQRYESGLRFIVNDMSSPDGLERGFVYWEKGPLPTKPKKNDSYYRISPKWYGWTYTHYRDEYRRNRWNYWWPWRSLAR